MQLSEWIKACQAPIAAQQGDAEISGICSDSRVAKSGDLFVCMPSSRTDTVGLIPRAKENGARAALASDVRVLEVGKELDFPVLFSPLEEHQFADSVARLAHAICSYPTRSMKVLGITGTNGKTTTAWISRVMLEQLLGPTAYLGTLGYADPNGLVAGENTTPFAVDLVHDFQRAQASGCKGFSMEVSSHALAEHRVDGVEFDAAVFTNLTQDHLDFHESMEAYGAAKARLFFDLPRQSKKKFVGAINCDDPVGSEWAQKLPDAISYSLRGASQARLQCSATEVEVDSIDMEFAYDGRKSSARVHLGGQFNTENIASAVAGCLALGFDLEAVTESLKGVSPVPGRFESISCGQDFGVIVDYAHTPDALGKLLKSVRELGPERIITVFGCGGDRDKTKRPLMARVVSQLSDLVVVTSDNPRTEDPGAIIQDVMAGILPGTEVLTFQEREKAIFAAIEMAMPGDVVVLAGKGSEDYQIIGHTKHPMDDRVLAKAAIATRLHSLEELK